MDNRYAEIDSTHWTLNRPARSTVYGCDTEFTHEFGCPRQGQPSQGKPLDCSCYVSRIRLVPTPVGDWLPTTDPDLAPELVFWEKSARIWKRSTYICAAVAGASLVVSILDALGVF